MLLLFLFKPYIICYRETSCTVSHNIFNLHIHKVLHLVLENKCVISNYWIINKLLLYELFYSPQILDLLMYVLGEEKCICKKCTQSFKIKTQNVAKQNYLLLKMYNWTNLFYFIVDTDNTIFGGNDCKIGILIFSSNFIIKSILWNCCNMLRIAINITCVVQ